MKKSATHTIYNPAAVRKALKSNGSVHVQLAENGTIYVSNGFFVLAHEEELKAAGARWSAKRSAYYYKAA